jgi:hypothetical protein
MAEISRRKFLAHGSVGVAAAAALVAAPAAARDALRSKDPELGRLAAGVDLDQETTAGPVVVHVADFRSGEVHLFVGEREITRRDPTLARAILGATR